MPKIPQYLLVCDSPSCGQAEGVSTYVIAVNGQEPREVFLCLNHQAYVNEAYNLGSPPQAAPAVERGPRIYRGLSHTRLASLHRDR